MNERFVKRLADGIIRWRMPVVGAILLITALFAFCLRDLKVTTNFNELLPTTHPFVKVHNAFRKTFGGANFLVIMLSVKKGDIFNATTLSKIKKITDDLETIPGIDRYKILSIASRKIKSPKITSWGMEATPVMWPKIPGTDEEMTVLKEKIYSNENLYGFYVSLDSKKSLIFADFFAEEVDYDVVYKKLEEIRTSTEDDNNIVSIVGTPMHFGVVSSMVSTMNYIMGGTAVVIPILLFLFYRSVWAMVMVPLTAVVSGIWGIGLMTFMGYNLDPLIFVMPFLIALMAFRHSQQLYNRYYEHYMRTRNRIESVRIIIEEMFWPGLTSIITDAFGIAVVGLAPIPLLRNMALVGAFWSVVTVIIGLILTPILLSYIPVSEKFLRHLEREQEKEHAHRGIANRFSDWLGPWLIGRGRYWVIITVLVVLGFSYYWSEKLIVGDAQVGSNLLYPGSRYNQDSVRINKNLPLINPLYIIIKGDRSRSLTDRRVLVELKNFTAYMLQHSGAAGAQNIADPMISMRQKLHEDDPKWMGLPDNQQEAARNLVSLIFSMEPGDMSKFIDIPMSQTNVVLFYTDKTGPTIQKAIKTAREYITGFSDLPDDFHYKFAGGVIGTEAAINETVADKQLQTLLTALLGVFIFCGIGFRSLRAGLILTIPLAISNFMAFAYMAINQIGLSISTLPVSAVGIGLGVDYGIYFMARMKEEKRKEPGITVQTAILRSSRTYAKSVIFIASTLILGLLVWALSGLKFQAQMGVMLAIILFLNCLGAVFLVPTLTLILTPGFLSKPGR